MSRFWIGYECEGRFKGLKTLFIASPASKEEIEDLAKRHRASHLYFNAGKQEINDWNTIRRISDNYLITLEVTSMKGVPDDIIRRCHIMLRFESKEVDKLKETDTIKIESPNRVYCIMKSQTIQNDFECYGGDVEC